MNGPVSLGGLATSLVLVAVAVGISVWRRLGLEREILWAAVRAVVQLGLVGLALTALVRPETPLVWSWLWVVAMIAYAGTVARRRAPEVPGIAPLTIAAFAVAAVITLGVIFGFGVLPAQGRTIVPIAGMMVGNAMTATVLVARRLVDELRDKRDEVEARLALGLPSRVAATPYVRIALRAALSPQIETTKATGLVFLPGAMTGLILAGVSPADAVMLQSVVMFLVLGSVASTTAVVVLGLVRRLFTPDHRLRLFPSPDPSAAR